MTEWLSSDPQPVFIPSDHPELAPLLRQSTNQEPACQVAPSNGLRDLNCFHHSIRGRGSFLRYLAQTNCCHVSVRNHTTPATVCWGVCLQLSIEVQLRDLRKCRIRVTDSLKYVLMFLFFVVLFMFIYNSEYENIQSDFVFV